MKICSNCGLPIKICNALTFYRMGIQGIRDGADHSIIIDLFIQGIREEKAYREEHYQQELMVSEVYNASNRTVQ